MNRFLLSAAVVGVIAVVGIGAELKSGPPVGSSVPVFHPLNVTGASAGDKACLV